MSQMTDCCRVFRIKFDFLVIVDIIKDSGEGRGSRVFQIDMAGVGGKFREMALLKECSEVFATAWSNRKDSLVDVVMLDERFAISPI
mmetsp:Transcript_13866/g.22588  ORF Transcript_13866/g.22588 Transcript_13866/m.22588 type:complete len:87 (+) Transcript_13866:812-1072(+)